VIAQSCCYALLQSIPIIELLALVVCTCLGRVWCALSPSLPPLLSPRGGGLGSVHLVKQLTKRVQQRVVVLGAEHLGHACARGWVVPVERGVLAVALGSAAPNCFTCRPDALKTNQHPEHSPASRSPTCPHTHIFTHTYSHTPQHPTQPPSQPTPRHPPWSQTSPWAPKTPSPAAATPAPGSTACTPRSTTRRPH